jgi:hypothetical protein
MPVLHASRADIALLVKDGASQSGMGFRQGRGRSALVSPRWLGHWCCWQAPRCQKPLRRSGRSSQVIDSAMSYCANRYAVSGFTPSARERSLAWRLTRAHLA